MAFRKSVYLSIMFFLVSACASSPIIQPQINSLAVGGQYKYALKLLNDYKEKGYGYHNRLMYYLDSGMVNHFAGRYQESINAFDAAKRIYDELYTQSITKGAESWLVNDNVSPYRGEDHERVMINIFQAVNFMMLGDVEEAVVEARDVDDELKLINRQYASTEKNKYKEDAFARFLAGVLYQAGNSSSGYNDAFISYRKAEGIYQTDFMPAFDVPAPVLLKDNYLAVAEFMGNEDLREARSRIGNVPYVPLKERRTKAEVYLIVYYGLAPIKRASFIPIPLPDGYVIKFAFPRFDTRSERAQPAVFTARGNGSERSSATEIMTDISGIALQTFRDRKARVIAKSAARVAVKYAAEKAIESRLRNGREDKDTSWFRYLSGLYNLASEQADLRSWQTLPSEIHMAKLLLEPGEYDFFYNGNKIASRNVKAGETVFIPVREVRAR